MSKLIIALLILATILPLAGYLMYGNELNNAASDNSNIDITDIRQDPQPGDSPQCAACRQIGDAGPQAQCFQDFQCS